MNKKQWKKMITYSTLGCAMYTGAYILNAQDHLIQAAEVGEVQSGDTSVVITDAEGTEVSSTEGPKIDYTFEQVKKAAGKNEDLINTYGQETLDNMDKLNGDILIDDETNEIVKKQPGETVTVKAELDVTPVKAALDSTTHVEYANLSLKNVIDIVKLEGFKSEFAAEFLFDKGLEISGDTSDYIFNGKNVFELLKEGNLKVDKTNGKVLAILTTTKKYESFKEMYDDIMNIQGPFELVMKHVKITQEGRFQIHGTTAGYMFSSATLDLPFAIPPKTFAFTWNATQNESGIDAGGSQQEITGTIEAALPQTNEQPEPERKKDNPKEENVLQPQITTTKKEVATGVFVDAALWASIMGTSMIGAAGTEVLRRKKRNK